MPSFRDVGNKVGRGVARPPPKIWAEQFTLSQSWGQILPPHYYPCLQIFRPSDVLVFWQRAEQGRPGTFCSEGRGISDNSMKPELPSVLFDQNWLTPCQTVYNIVAHIVNPVSYLNSVLMLVSQNYNLKFTFNFSFETVIID